MGFAGANHFVVVDNTGSGISVIGTNAGIYMGTHHTGGFQVNAAIARAAANNYHISGSTPGDLCIASESGASMLFGVSPFAGGMDTFLTVSRLRAFNFYGADYKFHIGNNEKLSINSGGNVALSGNLSFSGLSSVTASGGGFYGALYGHVVYLSLIHI